jgi:hypothetical protein
VLTVGFASGFATAPGGTPSIDVDPKSEPSSLAHEGVKEAAN